MILRIATITDLVRADVLRVFLMRIAPVAFIATSALILIWQCVRVLG
jgi:hypothetical protein